MKVVQRSKAKGLKGAGSVSYQMVGPHSTGARKVLVTVVHVKPGGVTPVHEHKTCESMYYVLQGRGEVSDGRSKKVIGVDTAVFFPAGTAHGIRNAGRSRLVYLSCHAPPYEIEELYKEWAREASTLLSTGG